MKKAHAKKYPPQSPYHTRFGFPVDFSLEARARLKEKQA